MKNLVIVESPTKARTLGQFLGKGFEITASMGHVRDLPRGEFGVDVEHDFKPQYVIPKEKIKAVNNLAKVGAQAEQLWLATDPDREGEAIAWNLLEVIKDKSKLKDPKYQRVVFHEITKEAIGDAFASPRKIDSELVEAQQARRVLDRLVGYKLSPLLWKKVKSGLSAGRVQSVALRLIVDREREIEDFKAEEYWLIEVILEGQSARPPASSLAGEVGREKSILQQAQGDPEFIEGSKGKVFAATLIKIGDEKAEIKNQKEAQRIVTNLKESKYQLVDLKTKDVKKYPNPPFTTSTLQQAAATRLGFTPGRTMKIAQNLYESGLITYMRTDSVHLSEAAISQTRKYIEKEFGAKYLPTAARHYKVKSRLAQEAHEAIRPTNVQVTSDKLQVTGQEHRKLYDLIHKRMVVCQMAEAVVAETVADVIAKNSEAYTLRATGSQVKFEGWYKVYDKWPIKEQVLPKLTKSEDLALRDVKSEQKFTEPPPRFTEATLIKELEKNDIGRPSTYAPTISTLYARNYIEKLEGRKIGPTPVGKTTIDFLVKHFPKIVDLSFTAQMENDLDLIAQGSQEMTPLMKKFWDEFAPQVVRVTEEAEKMKVEAEVTDQKCEVCGKPMVIRYGRFGKFLACSGFPDCKNTKPLSAPTGLTCPDCGGNIVVKKTRRGKSFWGCSNWPKCKFASWRKPKLESKKEPGQVTASS